MPNMKSTNYKQQKILKKSNLLFVCFSFRTSFTSVIIKLKGMKKETKTSLASLKAQISAFKNFVSQNHNESANLQFSTNDNGRENYLFTQHHSMKKIFFLNQELSEKNESMRRQLERERRNRKRIRSQLQKQSYMIQRINKSQKQIQGKVISLKKYSSSRSSSAISQEINPYSEHSQFDEKLASKVESKKQMVPSTQQSQEIKHLEEELRNLIKKSQEEKNRAVKLQMRNRMEKIAGKLRYLKNQFRFQ